MRNPNQHPAPEVIDGPTVPGVAGVLYQVTLPSGMIVTNPAGFGPNEEVDEAGLVIVTEDGRVLVRRAEAYRLVPYSARSARTGILSAQSQLEPLARPAWARMGASRHTSQRAHRQVVDTLGDEGAV